MSVQLLGCISLSGVFLFYFYLKHDISASRLLAVRIAERKRDMFRIKKAMTFAMLFFSFCKIVFGWFPGSGGGGLFSLISILSS